MATVWKIILPFAILPTLLGCEEFHQNDYDDFGASGARMEDVDLIITEEDEVRADPATFVGKTVLVRGHARDFIAPRIFLLDYDGLIGGSTLPILVDNEMLSFSIGDKIEVIGKVETFVLADVERYLDYDLDNELYIDYENEPVLIAESIELLDFD